MNTNPYAERRFQEAREILFLKRNLKTGNLKIFIKLVEHEALTLHAMMMMSEPAFILMKTGTFKSSINFGISVKKQVIHYFYVRCWCKCSLAFPRKMKVQEP